MGHRGIRRKSLRAAGHLLIGWLPHVPDTGAGEASRPGGRMPAPRPSVPARMMRASPCFFMLITRHDLAETGLFRWITGS